MMEGQQGYKKQLYSRAQQQNEQCE